ncbi:MAG: lipopolysaccharide biosynthesis protein [Flavobacteriales bacterium]|nr:lipopolysaccharide biosynthesis protein [Flavobacteriales bacterium]
MFKKLNLNSEFIKHITVLMSGTVLAQILGLLLTPIITDIYTPEESAELDLFVRIVAVVAALATFRYELALPITKNDSHSFRLYRVAFRTTIIVTISSLGIILLPAIFSISIEKLIFYLLMPVAIFFLALNNMGTNWAIRNKHFKSISFARITNSVGANLTKIGLGLLNFGSIGLIIGMVLGAILATTLFIFEFITAKNKFNIKSNSPRNFVLAREYDEFPKVSLPHVLMDLGRDLLVAVMLLQLFSKEDFGLYGLSLRMLKVPLIFIGVALGQVFFQKCAEKINAKEDIIPIMLKAVRTLSLFSIVPFTLIFFFGEEIFAYVFSEKWRGAGKYSEILAPWFMMNFISSPISAIPVILRRQREFFIIALIGTATLLLSIVIPPVVFDFGIEKTLTIVSGLQALYLFIAINYIFSYARKGRLEAK